MSHQNSGQVFWFHFLIFWVFGCIFTCVTYKIIITSKITRDTRKVEFIGGGGLRMSKGKLYQPCIDLQFWTWESQKSTYSSCTVLLKVKAKPILNAKAKPWSVYQNNKDSWLFYKLSTLSDIHVHVCHSIAQSSIIPCNATPPSPPLTIIISLS